MGQDPIFDKAREDLYKNVLLVWMGVKPYSQPPPDFAQLLIGDAGAGPSGGILLKIGTQRKKKYLYFLFQDVGLPGRGRGRGGGRTGAGPYSGNKTFFMENISKPIFSIFLRTWITCY